MTPYRSQECAQGPAGLVDEPGEEEREDIADGAGQKGEDQGVAHHLVKGRIPEEHPLVVLPPDEAGGLQHVEVCEAQPDGGDHGDDGQQQEEQHEGGKKQIAFAAALDLLEDG